MIQSKTADPTWKKLYIAGGIAALLAVFVFRRNLGAELTLLEMMGILKVPPLPMLAADWIHLFQSNWLVGLTYLNFFDVIEYLLVGLLFLALYGALRNTAKSAMLIATVLGLIGITVYMASNQAFAMLALSQHYAAATTSAEQSNLLAAGEALLAENNPGFLYQGTGIYLSLFLVLLAGLIISIMMMRSRVFGKATAIMGILANGIGLCYFLFLVFAPAAIWIPHSVSAPFRMIWYFLVALRLFKLARESNL
ncbi:MAG: hypothetical protein ACM3XO_24720 [Bacteroidota bacterium]